MLITICKSCSKFLKEGESTYPITINIGGGMIEEKEVCGSCYETLSEQNESKLLLEQA